MGKGDDQNNSHPSYFLFQVKKGGWKLENQKLAMKDDEIREINQQIVLRSAKIVKEKVIDGISTQREKWGI